MPLFYMQETGKAIDEHISQMCEILAAGAENVDNFKKRRTTASKNVSKLFIKNSNQIIYQ